MATLGNTPPHVILDNPTPIPDGNLAPALKTLASYIMNGSASITAVVPVNQGTISGNITTNVNSSSYLDHYVQGNMFKAQKSIPQYEFEMMPHEVIKREILSLIVEQLMQSKHIEFTMMKDQLQQDMVKVSARIFVTPDSQVRLLRENGVK
jgi:hypothetical protein